MSDVSDGASGVEKFGDYLAMRPNATYWDQTWVRIEFPCQKKKKAAEGQRFKWLIINRRLSKWVAGVTRLRDELQVMSPDGAELHGSVVDLRWALTVASLQYYGITRANAHLQSLG